MKLVRNAGTDRVLDLVEPQLAQGNHLDLLTPTASVFAFEAIRKGAVALEGARLVLPSEKGDLALQGTEQDRAARNRLQAPRLAKLFAEWLRTKGSIRHAPGAIPQGLAVVRGHDSVPLQAVHGSFGLTTEGLGLTPGNPLNFIQASETPAEAQMLGSWFEAQWAAIVERGKVVTAFGALLRR